MERSRLPAPQQSSQHLLFQLPLHLLQVAPEQPQCRLRSACRRALHTSTLHERLGRHRTQRPLKVSLQLGIEALHAGRRADLVEDADAVALDCGLSLPRLDRRHQRHRLADGDQLRVEALGIVGRELEDDLRSERERLKQLEQACGWVRTAQTEREYMRI